MPWDLPRGFELAWWTVVGLFVGSFLNVCIHRLPKPGASVWSPRRSHCPSCSRQLTWRENVPLVSWAIQLGRCDERIVDLTEAHECGCDVALVEQIDRAVLIRAVLVADQEHQCASQ